jgi:hypothetical protein
MGYPLLPAIIVSAGRYQPSFGVLAKRDWIPVLRDAATRCTIRSISTAG